MNTTSAFKFLVLPLLISAVACSKKNYPAGNYQEIPVKADGDLGEWSSPLRFISSAGSMQYNVTNDNHDLYICLETHDEATALKILRAGIDIYIDPTGGRSKKTNIAFPLPALQNTGVAKNYNSTTATRPGKDQLKQSLLIQAVDFRVEGFANMENRTYSVHDTSHIKLAMRQESSNGLGYELIVPLQYIPGSSIPGKSNISVGIVINALKAPSETSRGNSGGQGGGGMGGGGHRGGGGGRMGGGGGNYQRNRGGDNDQTNTTAIDRTALFKADTNWYQFKLAVKK